ncbi:hypothetical protein [Agrobacterium vitis]|uniref:hypothetical protein n=1 Tax=Agrobacterium vitis TaxID=373 RepID=UPI001F4776AB|nr:hypothetical protein [Agrobacterium vitis]
MTASSAIRTRTSSGSDVSEGGKTSILILSRRALMSSLARTGMSVEPWKLDPVGKKTRRAAPCGKEDTPTYKKDGFGYA